MTINKHFNIVNGNANSSFSLQAENRWTESVANLRQSSIANLVHLSRPFHFVPDCAIAPQIEIHTPSISITANPDLKFHTNPLHSSLRRKSTFFFKMAAISPIKFKKSKNLLTLWIIAIYTPTFSVSCKFS